MKSFQIGEVTVDLIASAIARISEVIKVLVLALVLENVLSSIGILRYSHISYKPLEIVLPPVQ